MRRPARGMRLELRVFGVVLPALLAMSGCAGEGGGDGLADVPNFDGSNAADPGADGGTGPDSGSTPFIDWAALSNPVLMRDDAMLKDQSVVFHDGWFYIFASVRFEETDAGTAERRRPFFRTRDFKAYEDLFDPDIENGGSPDATFHDGLFYMVFQLAVPPGDEYARHIFYSTSSDLVEWTPAAEIAPEMEQGLRRIDGALGFEGGRFYFAFKADQFMHVARSAGPALDGRWEGPVMASPGEEFGWAENYQFIKLDGKWRMVATAHDPAGKNCESDYTCGLAPFIYKMNGDGTELDDWATWVDKTLLEIPVEGWNTVMHANTAYLCDWRVHDGYFYLFYAGSNDSDSFEQRGHAKLGVARSRDLVTWHPAGAGDQ